MIRHTLATAIIATAVVFGHALSQPSTLGEAPAFSLADSKGATISLSQFKGKYVVLEWWNYQCPIVRRHYDSGNMQSLQRQLTEKGVVWLSINSSAAGKQGNVDGPRADEVMKSEKGAVSHILLDHDGKVGRAYGAKTTPQMVLISPQGEVLYNGAIDNMPNASREETSKAENYVLRAYGEAVSGKEVSIKTTRPYGCSVKY
ncbi:MAG: redoxin domain-containing protein [Armatimonadetes bacterium]|nr:redoxin domain-containing protein [Armatimonadota bacterium]